MCACIYYDCEMNGGNILHKLLQGKVEKMFKNSKYLKINLSSYNLMISLSQLVGISESLSSFYQPLVE